MRLEKLLRRHYLRIIQQWPRDPLRPDVSFPNALQKRIAERFPSEEIKAPVPSATQDVAAIDESKELAQVNALYSLLENRYSKAACCGILPALTSDPLLILGLQYPLSDSYMRPASNPSHYTDLIAELDAAPNRSWLATRLNKWKGFLRMS